MIWLIIFELVIAAIVLFFSIYTHELGHMSMLKKFGYKESKIKFSKTKGCLYVNIPNDLANKE